MRVARRSIAPQAFRLRAALPRWPFAPVARLGARTFARAITPAVTSSGTRLPTDIGSLRIAMRLRARGSVFSLPAFLPQRGVLLLFRVDELLAGIAMLASGAPIATALLLIRPAL
jgi:hypothetical protein